MHTAYTNEIDDIDAAVADIKKQLDAAGELLENSVALFDYHYEFYESGVARAVADNLPFDTVGNTNHGCCVNGRGDQLTLAVTILTSDDIVFVSGCSEKIQPQALTGSSQGERADDIDLMRAPLADLYENLASKRPGEKPAMMLLLSPALRLGGDPVVRILDECSGGVPIFGTAVMDFTKDSSRSLISYNGEYDYGRFCMILLYGDFKPDFFIGSVLKKNILTTRAVITKSNGNIINEINGMTALEYLESQGFVKNGEIAGMPSMALLAGYEPDKPIVARRIMKVLPDGSLLCGGDVPQGEQLSIAGSDVDDIVEISRRCVRDAREKDGVRFIFMLSCIGRIYMLGTDPTKEMRVLDEEARDDFGYVLAYCGGQFCPVRGSGGEFINKYHNFSLIAFLF